MRRNLLQVRNVPEVTRRNIAGEAKRLGLTQAEYLTLLTTLYSLAVEQATGSLPGAKWARALLDAAGLDLA